MAQQKPIGFQLVDITTEQFALLEENFVESEQVSLKTGIDFKIDFDNKLLGCEAKFVFGQNEVMFLMIEVACHFEVKKKDWESFKIEERFVVPSYFLEHLAVLTVGTTRGVLFAKTENTQFSQFIIPTVNIAQMKIEDGVFSIED